MKSVTKGLPATEETALHEAVDRSGFQYFSEGQLGAAHDLAHRMLDEGREQEGYLQLQVLLQRLQEFSSSGLLAESSDWIHLQWHMAVFEIAVGRLNEAHERFRRHILPQVKHGRALTDGPSLLWRLHLAEVDADSAGAERDRDRLELEWGAVRDVAVARLTERSAPYVTLHHLLAVAGARDVLSIDRWMDAAYSDVERSDERFLLQLAWGLRTFANGDFEPSSRLLDSTVRRVSSIGGSAAQNELFVDLGRNAQECWRLAVAS